jgi:hypothetical protein
LGPCHLKNKKDFDDAIDQLLEKDIKCSKAGQKTTTGSSELAEVQITTPGSFGLAEVQTTTPGSFGLSEGQPTTPGSFGLAEGQSTTPGSFGLSEGQPTTPGFSDQVFAEVQTTTPGSSGLEEYRTCNDTSECKKPFVCVKNTAMFGTVCLNPTANEVKKDGSNIIRSSALDVVNKTLSSLVEVQTQSYQPFGFTPTGITSAPSSHKTSGAAR